MKNKLIFVGGVSIAYVAGVLTVPILVDRYMLEFAKKHPDDRTAKVYVGSRQQVKNDIRDIFNGSYEHKRTMRKFDEIVRVNQLDQ